MTLKQSARLTAVTSKSTYLDYRWRQRRCGLGKEAKNQLVARGIIVKAIHIGHSGKSDTEKFKKVWEQDGALCKDVSHLVRAISKLLQNFLNEL